MLSNLGQALKYQMRSERGAVMVEYGMLLLFIALAAVGAIVVFGGRVAAFFSDPELIDYLN